MTIAVNSSFGGLFTFHLSKHLLIVIFVRTIFGNDFANSIRCKALPIDRHLRHNSVPHFLIGVFYEACDNTNAKKSNDDHLVLFTRCMLRV
jgi:hypothetical protein